MQTFLFYKNFESTALILDYRRLGKQRVEAYQLIKLIDRYLIITNNITNPSLKQSVLKKLPWGKHPANLMWVENISGLIYYCSVMCIIWNKVFKYKDTILEKLEEYKNKYGCTRFEFDNLDVIVSHRKAYLYKLKYVDKDLARYSALSKLWTLVTDEDGYEYVWPVNIKDIK